MALFRSIFRPSKSGTPKPSRSRHAWSRLSRSQSQSDAVPLKTQPEPIATIREPEAVQIEQLETKDVALRVHEKKSTDSSARAQPESHASVESGSVPLKTDDGQSELSRSQRGSQGLSGLVSRFRSSKSEDRGSVSEIPDHAESQPTNNGEPTNNEEIPAGPAKKDSAAASKHSSTAETGGQNENRQVSSQSVRSHGSNRTTVTVCRHPSQRTAMPIQEVQEDWFWPGILNFTHEIAHSSGGSDPFSDGKHAEPSLAAPASSKYSGDQSHQPSVRESQKSSEASQGHSGYSQRENASAHHSSSKSRSASHGVSSHRTSSGNSQISRSSRMTRLDPCKAIVTFNELAARLSLQLSISADDPLATPSEDKTRSSDEDNVPRRRLRLLSRVRPVKSNLNLGVTSHPERKLRRTKTFAHLTRRPSPMSSLKGKTVETLARLGGHSFLMLPSDLAPSALQLPACIVATVMFLRKFGANNAELFVEPGDVKAATRLYNHFASQVLSVEKDEARIAITMRVIAIPHFQGDSTADSAPVLSVGWVLKALLAGLPGGILGSVRLYQTLKGIYLAHFPDNSFPRPPACLAGLSPPTAARVQLIALAITALASEMQCALICAVFGLLMGLLQETERLMESQQPSGSRARPLVAGIPSIDGLGRVFGPLLLGTEGQEVREGVPQSKVEREIEEQRVAELLLENWRNVSRQLR
ncbi:hypothetical protein NUU61_004100 [Penicillium alfredii]|uniref:Rho-GAP domain-containing protein n=1 Tax=Penicillium alfredii TaxID=1506179 RepID=A0A9W9KDL2_9EURO|nr:uncharacterized protein NUU61_004100 [Penicillium alfredii]KAJ5101878.1 hypothetical protein NUU61_004100 [Penicillium alfredii]